MITFGIVIACVLVYAFIGRFLYVWAKDDDESMLEYWGIFIFWPIVVFFLVASSLLVVMEKILRKICSNPIKRFNTLVDFAYRGFRKLLDAVGRYIERFKTFK